MDFPNYIEFNEPVVPSLTTLIGTTTISRRTLDKLTGNLSSVSMDLPERYIINEHVCVCHWEDGTITKSFKHEQDVFNKKIGFLLCCFRHYNADKSINKRKKMLSWIKFECLEDYLFDMFVEKTGMTVKQAEAYIRDLKVEEPKSKDKKQPKHMKEENANE